MKKISTITGDQAKALGSLLERLSFLTHLQVLEGEVSQRVGDEAYLTADLSSLMGNMTMNLMLDPREAKALKAIDPGDDNVEVVADDERYTFRGGNYEVTLSRHVPLTELEGLPQNIETKETLFKWGAAAGTALQKAYTGILVKKGPLVFEFDTTAQCTGIVNQFGSRLRLNSQTMIPTEQRVVDAQTQTRLHSFWLHELKAESVSLRIHKAVSSDAAYGEWDYWLDADLAFGSGVVVTLIEKLLQQLW